MRLRLSHLSILAYVALYLDVTVKTSAFVVKNPHSSRSSVITLMAKVKRGKLVKNVEGATPSRPRKKSRKTGKASAAAKSTEGAGGVSPDLAKWISSSTGDEGSPDTDTRSSSSSSSSTSSSPADASTFQSFNSKSTKKNKTSTRRARQSERLAAEQAREAEIQSYVTQLQDILGIVDDDDDDNKDKKKNKKSSSSQTNISDLLSTLRQLTTTQLDDATTTEKSLLSAVKQLTSTAVAKQKQQNSKTTTHFRLAWVGSDDAICHVGTSLHKVPLARLQEIFLTLPGRNQVVLQEVIRILGPFPNVRNTLQGTCRPTTSASDENAVDWNWTWESMIDGTGKEILSGKEENTRDVPLNVHFAHPSIIVASVPGKDDPFAGTGENILLFLREKDLELSLEKLRVA